MRRTALFLGFVLVVGASSGCMTDRRILLTKQLVSSLNEGADMMCQMKDTPSAKAWTPRLKRLAERMADIFESIKKLPSPSEDDKEEVKAVLDKDAERALDRFFAEWIRILLEPEIWAIAEEAINKIPKDLDVGAGAKVNAMNRALDRLQLVFHRFLAILREVKDESGASRLKQDLVNLLERIKIIFKAMNSLELPSGDGAEVRKTFRRLIFPIAGREDPENPNRKMLDPSIADEWKRLQRKDAIWVQLKDVSDVYEAIDWDWKPKADKMAGIMGGMPGGPGGGPGGPGGGPQGPPGGGGPPQGGPR